MQLFWDFLRYGVPTTVAITGGMLASGKGWKTAPIVGAVAVGWGVGWLGQYLISRVIEPSIEELPVAAINPGAIVQNASAPSADQVMDKVAGRAGVQGFYTPTLRGKDGNPKQEGVVIDMHTRQVADMQPKAPPAIPPPTPMGTSGFDPGGSYGSQGTE